MIVKGYLFSFLYAVAVLVCGALAHRLGVKKTYTRKLVHILVGFEWFILSYYHKNTPHFLLVCLFFLTLLFIIYRKNWLPMMSSDSDNAPGTVYYALSMSILALISVFVPKMLVPFGIGVLATSLGDGFGGVFGSAIPKKIPLYKRKTLFGSLAVFFFSFLSVILFDALFTLELGVHEYFAIAFLSSGIELLCSRGLDNLFLPLGVSFFSYLLIYVESVRQMSIALSLTPLLFALTVERKKLTFGGAMTAVVLNLLVALAFGDKGFSLLITYFIHAHRVQG